MIEEINFYLAKATTFFVVAGAVIMGRLMYHASEVQKGNRKFWSVILLMDGFIAAGMGLISYGGCIYLGINGAPMAAIIALSGYLGPHYIDVIVAQKIRKKEKSND